MESEQNGPQHWHRHRVRRCAGMLLLSLFSLLNCNWVKEDDTDSTEVMWEKTQKMEAQGDFQSTPCRHKLFRVSRRLQLS